MAIREHPKLGTVLMCDFGTSFREPEMVKRRPVVVISPKIVGRPGLCTVVALSTTAPDPVMQYHAQIDLRPKLPAPMDSDGVWIKGDMIYAVGLQRLDLIRMGKDQQGRRAYITTPLPAAEIRVVRRCVLSALGLAGLTKSLP